MRIGSFVPAANSPEEWVRLHVERGLGAAYWPLPVDATAEQENAYVNAARSADLVIAEVGIWNNLLEKDPAKREANIDYAIKRLAQAERIGARCCVNISGSHAAQWDGPDPRNLDDETFNAVVQITQRIIDAVKPTQTAYALEPMPYLLPYDIDSTRRLIDAVDREAFKVHVDMVNMLNSFDRLMHNGDYTRDFFAHFASHICSVHAKDVTLLPTLTLHIAEAIPGEGQFDFDALLSACARLSDVPVLAEHLNSDEEYLKAFTFLQNKAKALGLPLTKAKL